jgi:hypothetical protein
VWWSAKHKFDGTVHLAVSISNGKITRCGKRIYPSGKAFKLYEWTRHGNSPITPTCGVCLKLRKYDMGELVGNPVYDRKGGEAQAPKKKA